LDRVARARASYDTEEVRRVEGEYFLGLEVRAELPGARPEEVEVTVHQGVLTISGKRE
jgi:HSP20 family molecular chaperone IbpA